MKTQSLVILVFFLSIADADGQRESMPSGPVTAAGGVLADMSGIKTATAFVGSDIGAQINAAAATLGAQGGKIFVPAAAQCYNFSTPIVFHAAIMLEGHGPSTCLTWTGGAGIAIKYSGIGSRAYVNSSFGVGMRDITIQGNSTPSGSTGSTCLSLDNVAGFRADRMQIMLCQTGLIVGNNTYILDISNSNFRANYQSIVLPGRLTNSGENMTFYHDTISNGTWTDGISSGQNCISIGDPTSWTDTFEVNFTDDSFDACQVVVNSNKAMQVRFTNPHFEDVQKALDYPFVKLIADANGNIVQFINPEFFVDATAMTQDAFVELNGYSRANVINPGAFVYGGTNTPSAWFRMQGPGAATLTTSNPQGFASNFKAGNPGIPVYSTDGTNGANVYSEAPAAYASRSVDADDTVVLAQGNILSGIYMVTWPNVSSRFQTVVLSVGATAYGGSGTVNVLNNYAYQSKPVLSNFHLASLSNIPQLVATVGDRNGTHGPMTVQWLGDSVYRPSLLPGGAVGRGGVVTDGLSEGTSGKAIVTGTVTPNGPPSECTQFPCVVASAEQSTTRSQISPSTVYTTPSRGGAGHYRMCSYLHLTIAGSTGTIQPWVTFTDNAHASGNKAFGTAVAATTQWSDDIENGGNCAQFYSDANAAIGYGVLFNSVSGTPTVAYSWTLERLK